MYHLPTDLENLVLSYARDRTLIELEIVFMACQGMVPCYCKYDILDRVKKHYDFSQKEKRIIREEFVAELAISFPDCCVTYDY